ncbi:MAG TPA: hypothetical protein VFS29_01190 [Motilibacteraceae bacterium]|nr:hypothetical protein [Motilibacteraceae bacterium]
MDEERRPDDLQPDDLQPDDRQPDDRQPGLPAGDLRPRDHDLPPLPPGVVVPDDASALAADREAWVRELRGHLDALDAHGSLGALQQRAPHRPLPGRAGRLRFGVFGAVLALVLAGAAAAGSLLLVLVPRTGLRTATALPLASTAAARSTSPGEPGALLPDTQVRAVGGVPTSVREVRPALLALVGPGVTASCRDCRTLLDDAALQAAQAGVRLWLVGPAGQVPSLVTLAHAVGNGASGVLEDVDGDLARQLSASGITLVLVHADGVVAAVRRDAAEPLPLAPDLSALRGAGAGPQLRSGSGSPTSP